MAKDIRDGVEHVDDKPVSEYMARLTGSFDVEPDVGQTFVQGDLRTFLVTARLGRRQSDPNDKLIAGTVKLTDVLKIEDVISVNRDKATFMLDSLGVKVIGVNELPESSRAAGDPPVEEESEENLFTEDDFVEPSHEWTDNPLKDVADKFFGQPRPVAEPMPITLIGETTPEEDTPVVIELQGQNDPSEDGSYAMTPSRGISESTLDDLSWLLGTGRFAQ